MFRGFHSFFQMSMKYDKKYFAFMVLNQAALALGAVAAMVLPRFLINAILSKSFPDRRTIENSDLCANSPKKL